MKFLDRPTAPVLPQPSRTTRNSNQGDAQGSAARPCVGPGLGRGGRPLLCQETATATAAIARAPLSRSQGGQGGAIRFAGRTTRRGGGRATGKTGSTTTTAAAAEAAVAADAGSDASRGA